MTGARVLTLLGAPGCHLCHDLRAVAEPVARALGFTLDPRDVHERAEWRAYRLEIPVLLWDADEVVRHRSDAGELERRLRALEARRAEGAPGV